MNQAELDEIIQNHALWLKSNAMRGKQADFSQNALIENHEHTENLTHFHFPSPKHAIQTTGKNNHMVASHFKKLSFGSANLTGAIIGDALFEECEMSNAVWDDCDFGKAIFYSIHLKNNPRLYSCIFQKAALTGCEFRFCTFDNLYWDKFNLDNCKLYRCKFIQTKLQSASFDNTYLFDTEFDGSYLYGASFKKAKARQCIFKKSRLCPHPLATIDNRVSEDSKSMFVNSLFEHCTFSDSNLSHCIWSRAILRNCSFEHCNLDSSHLKSGCLVRECSIKSSSLKRTTINWCILESIDISSSDFSFSNIKKSKSIQLNFELTRAKNTSFQEAKFLSKWSKRHCKRRRTKQELLENSGCTVDGLIGNEKLANYLHGETAREAAINNSSLWSMIWFLSSNCGRSVSRWAVSCFGLISLFAIWFWALDIRKHFHISSAIEFEGQNWLTQNIIIPFYYSTVTFTSLGYGDISPKSTYGFILASFEIILGFVMLGGLVSLISSKILK